MGNPPEVIVWDSLKPQVSKALREHRGFVSPVLFLIPALPVRSGKHDRPKVRVSNPPFPHSCAQQTGQACHGGPRDRRRRRFKSATPLFSMLLLVAIGGTPWYCRPGSLARSPVPDDVGVDRKSNMEVPKPPCPRDNGGQVGFREPRSWPDDWPVIRPGRLPELRRVSRGKTACSVFCVLCSVFVLCRSPFSATSTMFSSISLHFHRNSIKSKGRGSELD